MGWSGKWKFAGNPKEVFLSIYQYLFYFLSTYFFPFISISFHLSFCWDANAMPEVGQPFCSMAIETTPGAWWTSRSWTLGDFSSNCISPTLLTHELLVMWGEISLYFIMRWWAAFDYLTALYGCCEDWIRKWASAPSAMPDLVRTHKVLAVVISSPS